MTHAKKINLQYGGLLLKKRLKFFSFVNLLIIDYGIAAITLLIVILKEFKQLLTLTKNDFIHI